MKQLRMGKTPIFSRCLILLAMLLSIGCQRTQVINMHDGVYRLPKRVSNTADGAVIALQRKLARCGILVITEGQDYLISIPSSVLFPDQSPRLTWQSYGALNVVAEFMKQFRKVAVNVTSHSSKYISTRREQSLTEARARAVADYLWSQGIDSRMIITEGAGSDKPISANPINSDRSINSRIEITFRDTIV